jgi:hypothetical protein
VINNKTACSLCTDEDEENWGHYEDIMCHSYTVMSSVISTKKFVSRPLEVP